MYATALTKTAPAVQTLLEKGEGGSHTHKSGSGGGGGGGRGAASTLTNKMHTIHIMHTTYKTNAHATTLIAVKVAFATDSSYT